VANLGVKIRHKDKERGQCCPKRPNFPTGKENTKMKKILIAALVVFAMMVSGAFAEPDWSVFNGIVDDANDITGITEDLTGYHTPTDVDPYSLGYIGGHYDTYCNTDRSVEFVNWVSMAQWMRVQVDNMYLHVMLRKPGVYTVETPMSVRIASNGDVLVTFQELWGSDGWDAAWHEFNGKSYPQLADALEPQQPVDKKYKIVVIGDVEGSEPTGFEDIPAGDEVIKFLNSLELHNLENPTEGFDLTFQELPVPCNTVGDYVLIGRMVFQAVNQMWYIDTGDGTIDRGLWNAQGNVDPPFPYQN